MVMFLLLCNKSPPPKKNLDDLKQPPFCLFMILWVSWDLAGWPLCCPIGSSSCRCSQVVEGAKTFKMTTLMCLETWWGWLEGWNFSLCFSFSLCGSSAWWAWASLRDGKAYVCLCLDHVYYSLNRWSHCEWGLYKSLYKNKGNMTQG